MQTDKAQLVRWVVIISRVSDRETFLLNVDLMAQDFGTFRSRKGMNELHTDTALDRSRVGSNGFAHQLGTSLYRVSCLHYYSIVGATAHHVGL